MAKLTLNLTYSPLWHPLSIYWCESGAEWLRKRYKHVLCDEWQDVDKCQYELLKALVLPYQTTGVHQDRGERTNSSGGGNTNSRVDDDDDDDENRSDDASDGSDGSRSADHIVHSQPPPALPLARTLFVVGDTAQVTPLPLIHLYIPY